MLLTQASIQQLETASIEESLYLVTSLFPGKVVFSSSLGLEDQVITDIIGRNKIPIEIFTIDTGRLFNETYEILDRTIARYKKNIKVYFPHAEAVETFVMEKGINAFYESVENRKSCCYIRKVEPLNRALTGARIWITGLRAEQSANRQAMQKVEWDEQKQLYKFNPLLHWKEQEVVDYVQQNNVPYNRLHDHGFPSIGCAPCTKAVVAGEDPRSGRWWWETSQKECGLHETLIKQNA